MQMQNTKRKRPDKIPESSGWELFRQRIREIRTGKEKIITAQESIPFETIYYDGIMKVHEGYYSMIIEFEDVTYLLLDKRERAMMRENYQMLLDYFDPKIHMQMFLFNRKVDDETLQKPFRIAPKDDGLDDLREEYLDFLQSQAVTGNNGIVRSKYLIFGTECKDIQDARIRLMNVAGDLLRILTDNIRTVARLLNGEEWLKLLYDYYNQDSRAPFQFSWADVSGTGNSVKDYITPPAFDFRHSSYFRSGSMYGGCFYFSMIAPEFRDNMMKDILSVDGNITVSMHMNTVDPVAAKKLLKRKLTDVQSSKINNQKRAVRDGYDMDILPPDILTYEEGIKKWLDGVNTKNRKMINVTFLITCFAPTRQELDLLEQRISGVIQVMDMEFKPLLYQQEQAFMSSAPIGINRISIERPLDTVSFSYLIPFNVMELFMSGRSYYCGLNSVSNNIVMADRTMLQNSNGIILGIPGSGKSFWAKLEIFYARTLSTDHCIVLDPEGEYFAVVEALHGQVIRIALDSKEFINPMDIQISHQNDPNAMNLKSDFILTFLNTISGDDRLLEADEKGIVDYCLMKLYRKYFEDPQPEKMPILEDLYNELLEHENPKAKRIADCLYLYVHGSQNYFNHRTNVDTDNPLICYDISGLTQQLHNLGILIIQDAVWNRVSKNNTRRLYTRFYSDEFHVLLKNKKTADYMINMWKRLRKWNGIPTAITQNASDFLKADKVESILENSEYKVLMNQNAQDQELLKEKFHLTSEQMKYINNSDRGCGLLLYKNQVIPVSNKFPENMSLTEILSKKPGDKDEEQIEVQYE